MLLLHAHKCSQRTDKCHVPHCLTMRNVLTHMSQCNEGRTCTMPHCASSRQIIAHWKNCSKPDCPVCQPLRANNQQRTAQTNTSATASLPNTNANGQLNANSNIPNGASSVLAAKLGANPPANTNPSANTTGLTSSATFGSNNTSSNDPMLSGGGMINNNNNNNTSGQQPAINLLQQPPQQPRIHKPWHDNITVEMRKHLVQKIIQTIFPTQDHNIYRDPRLSNLVNYAIRTECEMYEQAKDQEEYFHLLAERIYKIQKEFEDKQKAARGGGNNPAQPNRPAGGLSLPNDSNRPANDSNSLPQIVAASTNQQMNSLNSLGNANISQHSSNDLSTFTTQLNPLKPYNPDLSAGNEGPPNKLAPLDDSTKKQPNLNMLNRNATPSSSLDPFSTNKLNATATNSLFGAQSSSQYNSSTNSISLSLQSVTNGSSFGNSSMIKEEPSLVDIKTEIKIEPCAELKAEPANPTSISPNKPIKTEQSGADSDPATNGPSSISPAKQNASSSSATSSSATPSSSSGGSSSADQPAPNSAQIVPSIATTIKGPNNKPIIKFPPEYLVEKLMPTFETVYNVEPESVPFREPVNPELLGLPDYFNVVKKPMDLSTIKKKLDDGAYSNPQEYVDDMWLMFNNAWLYNKKTSKVYKCCTKLSEIFAQCIDNTMREMGYCCGQQFTFHPQVLFCYGNSMCCTIPRDGVYYLYANTDAQRPNVNCDKYTYCLKCFEAIKADTVPIGDDPSQQLVEVKKSAFSQMKNDHEEPEQFVDCSECGRKCHQICALYMEQIFTKFVCDTCNREKKLSPKKDSRYTPSKLARTQLGDFLENRVNNYLKRASDGDPKLQAGRVTIRILNSVDKVCEIKQMMKNRFEGEVIEQFPFKTKAIFAFEEIDGTDVVFFGMHVQEYGSECSHPNTRRVYISYLDSVFFFRPKELRTSVYHEILIGYLDYAKRLGYQWAHIWACPPSEGDDYIFHCHPPEQKVPKPKRLQDWYKKMLDRGVIERVVIDYKDIHKDAIENGMKTPLDIPYFEGDFWPNVLEECIKESEQEEEKRRKEEAELAMAAANEDFSTGGDDTYETGENNGSGSLNSNGKKKNMNNQQKKKNIKSKLSQRKSVKKVGSSSTDLMTKILSTMEKHKEVFFVIRLLEAKQVAQMGPIVDKDPSITCDLMNGRDEFLNFARDKHHEFSSLRRAKYSSLALLYELHNQGSEKFVYTCNKCKANVESRYHCTVCEDFDLCIPCYETKGGHDHKMDKLMAGASSQSDDASSSSDSKALADSKSNDAKANQKTPKPHIEMYLNTFMHAVHCRNANCTFVKCIQFKRVVQHSRQCQKYKNSQCDFCRQLLALCIYHAKSCKDDHCQVPFCSSIKLKLKQQKAFNSQAERRRMLMMNKTLRQSANMNMNPSSPGDEAPAQPAQANASAMGGGNEAGMMGQQVNQMHPQQPQIDQRMQQQQQMQHNQQQQQIMLGMNGQTNPAGLGNYKICFLARVDYLTVLI